MADWKKLEPIDTHIHQGCLSCPPVEKVASMDMLIAVGFGSAMVLKGDEIIYSEPPDLGECWTTADAEKEAAKDPDHDWRIQLFAPLRESEYQRQDEGKWVLVGSGMGFA